MQIIELEQVVDDSKRQVQEQQKIIDTLNTQAQAKDKQLQEKEEAFQKKERDLQHRGEQLRTTEQLLSEFQETLQLKDKTITYLHQTISAQEKNIQKLQQQDTTSRLDLPQQQPDRIQNTTVPAPQNDIDKMKWRNGKSAPVAMVRGAAVVHEKTAYFAPACSTKILSYQNSDGNEQWSQLLDNPNSDSVLAIIDGLLTSVGGRHVCDQTNTLLSLTTEGNRRKWSELFPPMPTPRSCAACVATEHNVVVAGGLGTAGCLHTVEMMVIETKEWTSVCPIPQNYWSFSATVHRDTLYLTGGLAGFSSSKSFFACYLPDLLPLPTTDGSRPPCQSQSVWKEMNSLPVTRSTLVSFSGHLLAIGGDTGKPTCNVYKYDTHNDSWTVVRGEMNTKRSRCFALAFPENTLTIVGGYTTIAANSETNTVIVLK